MEYDDYYASLLDKDPDNKCLIGTYKWHNEFPEGTFDQVPMNLLKLWSIEIDKCLQEDKTSLVMAFFVSIVTQNANDKYGVDLNAKEDELCEVYMKLIYSVLWYNSICMKSEETNLCDKIVFDYKSVKSIDIDEAESGIL